MKAAVSLARIHVRQAHRFHRRNRQGRPPRRSPSRRSWLFGAQRRPEATRPARRADPHRRSHRQRPGLRRADDRTRPSPASKPASRRARRTRWCISQPFPGCCSSPTMSTFTTNVTSTYNVIEAAMKLGVRKVVIASSETTYGVCFAEGDKDFHSFPLEEDYDIDPMDPTASRKSPMRRPPAPSPCGTATTSTRCASAT